MTNPTYRPLESRIQENAPQYQSEQEARIGRMLDEYDIPFFYRQARLIYRDGFHEAWYPAFTLPTYDGLVVEYAERTNTPETQAQRTAYRANHIPAVFVGTGDLAQPYWEPGLIARVERVYEAARARR